MKTPNPDFTDKVVSVLCVNEDTSQLIFNPSFEEISNRVFLSGTVPKDSSEDNWMEGLQTSIAWETVQDFVVFDSMEDYLQRLHKTDKKKKAKKKK